MRSNRSKGHENESEKSGSGARSVLPPISKAESVVAIAETVQKFRLRVQTHRLSAARRRCAAPKAGGKSAIEAAKAASASEATLAVLQKVVETAKLGRSTLGGRLDRAEANLRRSKDALERAERAVEAYDTAEGELKSLREEVAEQEPVVDASFVNPLVSELRKLLLTLEGLGRSKA